LIEQSPWAPLVFAVPSFAAQLLMPNPWIEDPPGFIPVFRIVAVYAVPFAVGWLLFLQSDLLETIARRAWLYAALAVVASVAYRVSYGLPFDRAVLFYLIRGVHAVAEWLLIFGVAGLFLRYLGGYSAYGRYLCDSSYFLYIAHAPVILVFQLLLRDVALPPLAKIFIVLAATIAVLLPLYRYAVRPTFIGAVLNGRRYPSTIGPVLEPGPQLEALHGEDRGAQDAVH
jgi:glucan biosynthesis protein C